MADQATTTASEPTTEATAPAVEAPQAPDTSTTETPQSEAEAPSTLLTGKEPEAPAEDEKTPPAENAALFGAPEGEYEITGLPEGMTVDKDALAVFEPIAKELGLSNEGMSKVAAVYAELLPKVTDKVVEGLQGDVAAQHAQWATDTIEMVKTDPVFEGKKLADVQGVAAKALDRFGGPELRTFLEETGLGNDPRMMKFAFLAGSAISEDTTFERGGPAPTTKSRTEKYYPSST